MPGCATEVQCPSCGVFKRKDKMLAHLASHDKTFIEFMTVPQRERILTIRKPFIYNRNNAKKLMFAVCLHCKKGGLSCSERTKMEAVFDEPHTECIKEFWKYEKMFESKDEPKTSSWSWKEQEKAKASVPKATTTTSTALPKDTEDNILKMWKLYEDARIADDKAEAERNEEPYEEEDEPEPDLMGKLKDILNDYTLKKRSIQRLYKTLEIQKDEISVLENDIKLKDEQIKRLLNE